MRCKTRASRLKQRESSVGSPKPSSPSRRDGSSPWLVTPTTRAPLTSPPITARSFADGAMPSVLQNRIVVSLEQVTARNGRAACTPMSYTSAACVVVT